MQYSLSSTAASSSSSSPAFFSASPVAPGITDAERERDAPPPPPPPVDTARFAVRPFAGPVARGDVFFPRPVVGTLSVEAEVDATGAGVALPSFFAAAFGLALGFALGLGAAAAATAVAAAGAFFCAGCAEGHETLFRQSMQTRL